MAISSIYFDFCGTFSVKEIRLGNEIILLRLYKKKNKTKNYSVSELVNYTIEQKEDLFHNVKFVMLHIFFFYI